eukprot:TRINITY_DN5358_c0_g1_i1.p1 TRINITY_DN5358_c0_g1~~TRINITY_DN5358_c0_g1_i1.p1  ORF type:complete len:205 (-),score=19.73 TRINITY_DN5358_c0_g1_i1:49-663(-)
MATFPDRLTLLEPVGQYAALQVTGRHVSKPVEGFVYAIDPDSNNHVLIHESESSLHSVVVFGHCITSSNYETRDPTPLVQIALSVDDFSQVGAAIKTAKALKEGVRSDGDVLHVDAVVTGSVTTCETKRPSDEPPPDNAQRKRKLLALLKKSRIPFQEAPDGEVVSAMNGLVKMYPPYDYKSCRCNNSVILNKVKTLLLDNLDD